MAQGKLRIKGVAASGIDADAQAFITAAGITDTTQKSAINTLVVNLKAYGIWSKMKAIYPMVGGTATTHKFNLKDPRDLDAAFRLVFNGGWVHSSTGAKPNGSNAYADTFLIPSTSLSGSSTHLSYYSRTNVVGAAQQDMGTYGGGSQQTYLMFSYNTQRYVAIHNSGYLVPLLPNTTGLLIDNRRNSSQIQTYKSGVLVNTASVSSVVLPTTKIYLGVTNGLGPYSTKECAFSTIGDGLTDTEATNLYTAIQAFQTTLGREIIENQVLNLDAGNTNSYPGTGVVWNDLSGNGRSGNLNWGVGYSSLNGGSLTFDGINDYVNVSDVGAILNNVNKFTLDVWFKIPNPSSSNLNSIFSFGQNNQYANDILLYVASNTIGAQVNTGGDGSAYTTFTSADWNNAIMVYDGTQTGNSDRLKIYINGVLQNLTYTYTVPATTSNLSMNTCGIGAYSTGGFNNLLTGNISAVKIYKTALTSAEALQNYNSLKSRYI